jgi:biuret amidohydrolase
MHRGHLGTEPDVTCPAPRARAVIDAHNEFHKACLDAGIPVIMCQHWQRHGGIDDVASRKRTAKANWRWLYELYLPPNPSMDQHSWEGTKWLDLMVEVDERDYFVRTKKRLSGFYPTDLEFLLGNLDVDNVVLTGTYTDACVLSTAFDAANRDFRVIVPGDVVAQDSHLWIVRRDRSRNSRRGGALNLSHKLPQRPNIRAPPPIRS